MIWRAHKKITSKRRELKKTKTNYRQLAFETRERSPSFKVRVLPFVISLLSGGIKETVKELENIFETSDLCRKVVAKMQKTILMDNETIIRKVLSGRVQSDIE